MDKKNKKEQKEEKSLNRPVAIYFKRKIKCNSVQIEFNFSNIRLDVLGYNSNEKCFYICEGKNVKSISGLGHAIGQLISYMSLIQNDGFYFLQVVNDVLKVNLNQLQFFFEKRSIKAKFYIVLPLEFKTQLEHSIEIVKENIGDFAKYIGICFARKGKVAIYYDPLVKEISIEKKYNTEEFLNEISEKFLTQDRVKNYLEAKIEYKRSVKFKRIKGNPCLHYEVWLKSVNKRERRRKIEIGFHIELGKPKQSNKSLKKRRNILKRLINKIYKLQYKNDKTIMINKKWGKSGKYWSKLYYETFSKKRDEFDEGEVKIVLTKLNLLFEKLNDELEKANWGRTTNMNKNTNFGDGA